MVCPAAARSARHAPALTPRLLRSLAALALLVATLAARPAAGSAAEDGRYFPETGHTVRGRFLAYWEANGGLAQQGYPISGEFNEVNLTDGRTYLVQYFERARFELHPENQAPHDVLLGLLGREQLRAKYSNGTPPGLTDSPPGATCTAFAETGMRVCGLFLAYWTAHGGLAQQGLPLTDLFLETNPTDGKQYPTQYFERARFEYHAAHVGTPYAVLLGLLGREQARATYPGGFPWGPTLAPLADGTTYTAPDGLFAVGVPPGWTTAPIFTIADVLLRSPEGEPHCRVTIRQPFPGTSLDALAAQLAAADRQIPGFALLEQRRVLVQGVLAYRQVYTYTGQGGFTQGSRILLAAGEYGAIANCLTTPAAFAAWSPTFDAIGGSLRVLRLARP